MIQAPVVQDFPLHILVQEHICSQCAQRLEYLLACLRDLMLKPGCLALHCIICQIQLQAS